MAWSHVLVRTRTGDPRLEVKPVSHSGASRMNESGTGTTKLATRDARYAGVSVSSWEEWTRPLSSLLVTCWDGVPVYAGLVLNRSENPFTGEVTLQHAELRWLLRRRFTRGVADYNSGPFTIAGKNAYGLANEILKRGLIGDGTLVSWDLPVVVPDGASGGRDMVIHPYTFTTIEDSLQQAQSLIGYDVHLQPRWSTAGRLEWVAQVGTPLIPGASLEWDLTARSPVMDAAVEDDAAEQSRGVFVLGKGSEEAMRLGRAAMAPGESDIPAVYRTVQEKDVDAQSLLDDMASAEITATQSPMRQWSLKATLPDDEQALAMLRPGTRIRLWQKSILAGEGWQSLYLIGASFGLGRQVTLEVQSA